MKGMEKEEGVVGNREGVSLKAKHFGRQNKGNYVIFVYVTRPYPNSYARVQSLSFSVFLSFWVGPTVLRPLMTHGSVF